jgi:hypothetical protein
MTSHVVVDGNLITGQNPFSSKEMAKVVIEQLEKNRCILKIIKRDSSSEVTFYLSKCFEWHLKFQIIFRDSYFPIE